MYFNMFKINVTPTKTVNTCLNTLPVTKNLKVQQCCNIITKRNSIEIEK